MKNDDNDEGIRFLAAGLIQLSPMMVSQDRAGEQIVFGLRQEDPDDDDINLMRAEDLKEASEDIHEKYCPNPDEWGYHSEWDCYPFDLITAREAWNEKEVDGDIREWYNWDAELRRKREQRESSEESMEE